MTGPFWKERTEQIFSQSENLLFSEWLLLLAERICVGSFTRRVVQIQEFLRVRWCRYHLSRLTKVPPFLRILTFGLHMFWASVRKTFKNFLFLLFLFRSIWISPCVCTLNAKNYNVTGDKRYNNCIFSIGPFWTFSSEFRTLLMVSFEDSIGHFIWNSHHIFVERSRLKINNFKSSIYTINS